MIRRAAGVVGWGILIIAALIFGLELAWTQEMPPVSMEQWATLAFALVLLVIAYAHRRDEVYYHHLPH